MVMNYQLSLVKKLSFFARIPDELKNKLEEFNSDGTSWYYGQILSFIMRPNEELELKILEKRIKMGLSKPFVG